MERRLISADSVRDATARRGDAVLVQAGRIVAVGTASELGGPDIVETHYPGATIVPGLRDAHLHPVGYTAALQRPSLKSAPDFEAIRDVLSDAIRTHPPGTAITGLRLDDESLREERLPDRHVLDAVSIEQPILLMRYCGHIAVANTAALALVGIDRDTPDPTGGVIDRDEMGDPTGVLRETAFEPLTAAIRPLAPPITRDNIGDALVALASTGLVGIGAMAATDSGLWGGASSELEVLLEAASSSPISLDVFVIAPTPEALREAADRVNGVGGNVRFAGVKMFSDGSLGGHTAAMHEPFADRPDEWGTDRIDPAWAERLGRASIEMGGRVAIHAIGDRANGGILDLMQRLIATGADPTMLRVEHASVLTQTDIERFGQLGVTASVQPAFIASETEWLEKRLGPERIRRTYPFKSLAEVGAPLAGGSDSPVEPPHPLLGMAAARDRLGLIPEEALTAGQALSLFTTDAARACGIDATLDAGAPADLTVLDTDPIEGTPEELRSAVIVATWTAGSDIDLPEDIVAWQA